MNKFTRMTGNKCLLDTSIIIHSFRKNNSVAERLDAIEEIFVPIEVIGELYFGAYRSMDVQKHVRQIQAFLSNCSILPADANTADVYGKIKAALMKQGRPIPENDLWIAALACQYSIPLLTTDHHFAEIEGVQLMQ